MAIDAHPFSCDQQHWDLIASGISHVIIYLRSSLGLPMEVDPDRIYQKGESHVDSISQDLAFLLLLC